MKKINFFPYAFSRFDFDDIDEKDLENIKGDVCNIEREYWTTCKDEINKLPVALKSGLKGLNRRINEFFMCPVEKTSFLEKIMSFFGLANRNEL